MSDSYNSNILQVQGTTWVPLGDPTTAWSVNSVGGVPLELILLPVGTEPTVNTKKQYTIGGIINNISSKVDQQCWFRCTKDTDIGLLLLRPTNLGEFNEVSMVKASVVDLHTQVINLSTRVTKNEIATNRNTMRMNIHEYTIQAIQASMAHLLAEYASMNVRIAMSVIKIKRHLSDRIGLVERNQNDFGQIVLSLQDILARIIGDNVKLRTDVSLDILDIKTKQASYDNRLNLMGYKYDTIAPEVSSIVETIIRTTIHDYIPEFDYDLVEDLDDRITNLSNTVNNIVTTSLLINTHKFVNNVQARATEAYFNELADAASYTPALFLEDARYILLNMFNALTIDMDNVITMRTNMYNYASNLNRLPVLQDYIDVVHSICADLNTLPKDMSVLTPIFIELIETTISDLQLGLVAQTEPPVEELPVVP